MLKYVQGNLLEADVEALVNTVNTVGVMGKGVALMFKEAFPANFKAYQKACKLKEIHTGKMFVTCTENFIGPKWIINFPTKQHWRNPSKMQWIDEGLDDLVLFIISNNIKSIALPPLGAGNGGLDWFDVRLRIEQKLGQLSDVGIIVFEPIAKYQNVAKRVGVEKLTPTRAIVAELIRRYSILGIECSLLEVQKLGYFMDRYAVKLEIEPFGFEFSANRYGPYSEKLRHMLNGLDGSYLHCDKRLSDAGPFDQIYFDDSKRDRLSAYLTSPEVKAYRPLLDSIAAFIDGFESPLGMELLATIDWLVFRLGVAPDVSSIKAALKDWPGGRDAGERKLGLFEDRIIIVALEALSDSALIYDRPKRRNAPLTP